MKYLLWAICLVICNSGNSQSQEALVKKYSKIVSPEGLKKQLLVIAGPEMEGRETATRGQQMAAAYIENEMKSIGLKPGNGDSYQMIYPLFQDSVLAASVTINGVAIEKNKQFSVKPDNYTARQNFGEIVYIDFDDSVWENDKLDIAGKLVMYAGEEKPSRLSRIAATSTINSLVKKGAAAAFIIDKKFPLATEESPISPLRLKKFPASQTINQFSIAPQVAAMIMGKDTFETGTKGCKVYQQQIAFSFLDSLLTKHSSNVLGVLEGTDKKDEWLLISAHYDHLGKKDSLIYFGADDDGSGTVSVLEIARAFAKAKTQGHGPRRNILFITFSGEEKGLLGSEYYATYPAYPLDKTSADLNIDMVGRSDSSHLKGMDSNYVYVVGDDKLSSELTPIAKAANKNFGLKLDAKYNDPKDKQRIYYRSDHYHFAKHGVPVMFYYDGSHPDYHLPSDTVDKIEFDLMTLRARYIFTTAWEIANRDDMLKRDLDRSKVGTR